MGHLTLIFDAFIFDQDAAKEKREKPE